VVVGVVRDLDRAVPEALADGGDVDAAAIWRLAARVAAGLNGRGIGTRLALFAVGGR
jgi:hypothetical protein